MVQPDPQCGGNSGAKGDAARIDTRLHAGDIYRKDVYYRQSTGLSRGTLSSDFDVETSLKAFLSSATAALGVERRMGLPPTQDADRRQLGDVDRAVRQSGRRLLGASGRCGVRIR